MALGRKQSGHRPETMAAILPFGRFYLKFVHDGEAGVVLVHFQFMVTGVSKAA
jgi:hypothetical protein